MGTVLNLRAGVRVAKLQCSECGASGTGSCDCGAPYVAAAERADAAVAANPQKSDRSLAKEIGVSHETVSKARRARVNELTPDTPRTGLDGKTYPARSQRRAVTDPDVLVKQANKMHGELYDFVKRYEARVDAWFKANPNAEDETLQMLLRGMWNCATDLNSFADNLDGKRKRRQRQ